MIGNYLFHLFNLAFRCSDPKVYRVMMRRIGYAMKHKSGNRPWWVDVAVNHAVGGSNPSPDVQSRGVAANPVGLWKEAVHSSS